MSGCVSAGHPVEQLPFYVSQQATSSNSKRKDNYIFGAFPYIAWRTLNFLKIENKGGDFSFLCFAPKGIGPYSNPMWLS